jgi:hypothetical protein
MEPLLIQELSQLQGGKVKLQPTMTHAENRSIASEKKARTYGIARFMGPNPFKNSEKRYALT